MRLQAGKTVEENGDAGALAAVELDGCEMADLVAELLAWGASARFVARGGSMSPWIRDGDVVTVEPLRARLGDVAAFRLPGAGGRLRVHRLVRLSRLALEVRAWGRAAGGR